ncbi:MAG: hypothetical protein ACYC0H_24010, partial [Solirubrobacteraceae bacterium]
PGVFDRPTANLPMAQTTMSGMTAQRVGDAWLVVVGGTGTTQRVRALHDLAVGPIHLNLGAPAPTGPSGGLCSIAYQPIAGMQAITQNAITSTHDNINAVANTAQRTVDIAYTQVQRDLDRRPLDPAQLEDDMARLDLAQQALQRLIPSVKLSWPTCATATFYYQQRWPMTATVVLATKACPGTRVPVPCDRLRPAWRNTLTRVLKPVPGQPQQFIVPANVAHPLETVKQIAKAWLIVSGGNSTHQQQLLLDHLKITTSAQLRTRLRDAITTRAAFCARQYPTAC